MTKIIYSSKSKQTLKEAAIYIAEESSSIELALKTVSKMRSKLKKRLEAFPYSGQFVTTVNGIEFFKIIIGRYTFVYKIVESEDEEIVVVTNVIHEKRGNFGIE